MEHAQRDEVARLARSGQALDDRRVVISIEPRTVSTAVAARIYGLSQRTIEQLIATEDFPSVRIGRRLLVPIAKADQWFERKAA